ncbi:MAG TPA: branched-chain amino acid ABC transporter permease [Anaeromyxobacter sp.]|nr:branched-chain amino acid ABC transporter permease [Anaeromyxobacter sp.]
MTTDIALLLLQDGVVNGAIYALLALALVLVFSVTRVIFIPQGEFVAFGGLTLAALEAGRVPGTLWLLCAAGAAVAVVEAVRLLRRGEPRRVPRVVAASLGIPAALALALHVLPLAALPEPVRVLLALALVVPLGPAIYRLVYEPLAGASVLVLLIVSVAVHVALVSVGLLFFGAEGARTAAFSDARFALGPVLVSAQSICVLVFSAALIAALALLSGRTLWGKALRASAMNRTGARLVGIPTRLTGRASFALAALVGAFSGVLVAPVTTLYYDTGFIIGLKGFVGAIVGALASYPLAAAGALLVGVVEAIASFEASAYREMIVFTLILPVLLWRSLRTRHVEEDE